LPLSQTRSLFHVFNVPTRLLPRLFLSHFAPLILLASALALLLAALVKVTMVLTTLKEKELTLLRDEGALHRAIWDVDVAMRHAHESCRNGTAPSAFKSDLSQRATALKVAVQSAPPNSPMLSYANDYLTLSRALNEGQGCSALLEGTHRTRETLDEHLTNLWVSRLDHLHQASTQREEEARRIGVTATRAGLTLTVASMVLALLMVRRMARSIGQPMIALSQTARRVGDGDLTTPVEVEGPDEIQALGEELERMRNRLSQLESTKQSFLASVSHELRTPLSMLREALELLSDGVGGHLEEKQKRVLTIARQACEREIRMVSTLLDLSRLRSGSPLRPKEGASVDAVIENALRDEQAQADHRGVKLHWIRGDETAPSLSMDMVLMERAIANLVRNAVAVSRPGDSVTIRRAIEVTENPEVPRRIRVTVSDLGPGVPESIRQIIFDAFVTHPVHPSGHTLGTGLGLALAREVARAHGGELVLDESVTVGATFHLWVPIVSPSHNPSVIENRLVSQRS